VKRKLPPGALSLVEENLVEIQVPRIPNHAPATIFNGQFHLPCRLQSPCCRLADSLLVESCPPTIQRGLRKLASSTHNRVTASETCPIDIKVIFECPLRMKLELCLERPELAPCCPIVHSEPAIRSRGREGL
jgi:hypothetical protein